MGQDSKVLHNKNFASFWTASFAYYVGIHMETTVYGLLVYTMTKSAFLLGLATAISTLGDFVSASGGFITDRMRKKNLLYIVQAILGIDVILTGFLLSIGVIEYRYVVILSLIHTMAMRFAMPVRLSFYLRDCK